MKVGDDVLTCALRPESYPIRYLARPMRPARIEPMSHCIVPCVEEALGEQFGEKEPGLLVTDALWTSGTSARVPAADPP